MDQDFENRPLKKAKNCDSSVLDDPLTSPSISASSMISDLQINSDPLGSPPSTTNSTSSTLSVIMNEEKASADDDNQTVPPSATYSTPSTVSEFMNEEKASEDDDNQTVSANDNNQLDEHEEITDDLAYDYLSQGIIFTFVPTLCIITTVNMNRAIMMEMGLQSMIKLRIVTLARTNAKLSSTPSVPKCNNS